ncbi:MAG TPA: polysaccharide deacetylase family protein [Acidimicrobiales bacterium]|nr:polysaccharide deacetylase family protein [Acidimicrobiales bacterium]
MRLAAITFDHLGTRRQMGALCEVVERHGVPATFFVTGERAAEDPAAVKELHDAGYEVGMHGWAHEAWSDLAPATERDLATRATDAIAAATGARPRAFRAPGGARSEQTTDVLADLGYTYDASLGDRMNLARLSPAIAQVPFVWPGVDGYWYLRDEPADPTAVKDAWLSSLTTADVFVTICHPEITGVDDDRLAALDAVIAAAVADPTVELCTAGAIAARIPA